MNQNRFPSGLIAGIIVALFFGIALYLRIALPYDQVFVGDWIKFTGTDAYYHMRIVDNLVHNFPNLITFDPYTFYPYGALVGWQPFFDWFLAGITLLIGLGSPTQHTIDVVGVYFPAVLGALTVIPVYFIGKELFNRWAGVIAAGLIAILPGEFLGRSILGFTDHHVAEVLFTTIAVLFLILAVKSARQKELTFNHLRKRNWTAITKPLVYSMLAGIFLGIYLLTWTGALLFVFIIFVYLIIQFIIDHLRGKSTDYLGIVGTVSFLFALAISLPLLPQVSATPLYLASLSIAILATVLLSGISRLLTSKEIKPAYYPLALVGLGLAGLGIFYAFNPTLLSAILGLLGYFNPTTPTTILEAQPLLLPGGNFSFSIAWGNFTTGLFLSFISLGILIYFIIKRGEADKTLFVVWSLVMLAATLGQRRFAYYFAINVALLTGYLSWLILEFSGFRRPVTMPSEAPKEMKKKVKQKKKQRDEYRPAANRVNMVLGVIVVFVLVFYPNIGPLPGGEKPAIDVASNPQFAPSDAWCESLSWLKENTPDPFGNPDFYHELYEPPPSGESYNYPELTYGVMAWWDYGHWITRISRRLPNATPALWGSCAPFFSAEDEAAANRLMDELGLKYVIVDYAIAMPVGKFHAVATLSGSNKENFYDVYYQPQDGRLKPVILFYPEYYRSMVVRLYNFDGKRVVPRSTMVISYEERLSREGQPYKEITSAKSFPSYEQAEDYISSQKSGNYRIVGSDPFVSPVPLQALEHYKLVYSSKGSKMMPSGGLISEVKIFEYVE
jgi:dolichyl-diphosphooligosaccharide--protein glycosyltransferase